MDSACSTTTGCGGTGAFLFFTADAREAFEVLETCRTLSKRRKKQQAKKEWINKGI
jgi:ribonuclease HI